MRNRACPGILQTTALVHEAWLRLRGYDLASLSDKRHEFAALSATVLRSVLVDEARREGRRKRGGASWRRIPLDPETEISEATSQYADLLELDEALVALEHLSPRRARIVELRFFGGLSVEHVAAILGVSGRTIETDWQLARAWLRVRLETESIINSEPDAELES